MEEVKGYEMVRLPHYDRHEMENCLEYYCQKRWLAKGKPSCSIPSLPTGGYMFLSVVTRLSSRVVAVVSKEILSLYLGQYTQVTRIQLLLYLLWCNNRNAEWNTCGLYKSDVCWEEGSNTYRKLHKIICDTRSKVNRLFAQKGRWPIHVFAQSRDITCYRSHKLTLVKPQKQSINDILLTQTLVHTVAELTKSVSSELWHMTAGNPKELNRLCSAL